MKFYLRLVFLVFSEKNNIRNPSFTLREKISVACNNCSAHGVYGSARSANHALSCFYNSSDFEGRITGENRLENKLCLFQNVVYDGSVFRSASFGYAFGSVNYRKPPREF